MSGGGNVFQSTTFRIFSLKRSQSQFSQFMRNTNGLQRLFCLLLFLHLLPITVNMFSLSIWSTKMSRSGLEGGGGAAEEGGRHILRALLTSVSSGFTARPPKTIYVTMCAEGTFLLLPYWVKRGGKHGRWR